ncbi:hypothetical protein CC80DRAFT_488225 [Byssothecium circinans]|uniref:F-box domain-containing protein n=1 Tax=Byssothecium circinans TaxID=147558 RepID=A0A6A5UAQ5_9PLEO|nr:hypothetical protein CC80DRAFT_488225 [Byssothecium circinans]
MSAPPMAPPNFLSLPPELLLGMRDFLPPDAILSLKLTHPIFNNTLPSLPDLKTRIITLSPCARFSIERLRILSTTAPGLHENRDDVRQRCRLCKHIYPLKMFTSSNSPACEVETFVTGNPRPEVVDLPPYVCAWHVARLTRKIYTGPGGRNEWVSDMRNMCMHNGCIQGWEECRCGCDSCGYQMVRTYTRYMNSTTECRKFIFWRNMNEESEDPLERSKGRLYVRESSISLPVAYDIEPTTEFNDQRGAGVAAIASGWRAMRAKFVAVITNI